MPRRRLAPASGKVPATATTRQWRGAKLIAAYCLAAAAAGAVYLWLLTAAIDVAAFTTAPH